MDHMGYPNRFLDTAIFKSRLTELGNLGLKSLMFAGEGEPLMHPDIGELAQHAKSSGIDISFTTNGALLTVKKAEQILPVTSWIKISVNAGTATTHAKLHRVKESVFDTVLKNISSTVALRSQLGSKCTIGAQMLLLPENWNEALLLTQYCRDLGVDYLVFKPYSQNPQSNTHVYADTSYANIDELEEQLIRYSTSDFKVVLRSHAMRKQEERQHYASCQALPFWAYLDSGGTLWSCLDHAGNDHFRLGNIYQSSFEEIWTGDVRRNAMKWFADNFNCSVCRVNCRMDEINRYLWELKNPGQHANFI